MNEIDKIELAKKHVKDLNNLMKELANQGIKIECESELGYEYINTIMFPVLIVKFYKEQ